MAFGKISVLALALALAAASSSYSRAAFASEEIIGGETVKDGDAVGATTVGLVVRSIMGTSICTGSIIAKDLVVTAGHCLGDSPSDMKIMFKKDIRSTSGTAITVKGMVRHPKYDQGTSDDKDMNDIALIRFDGGLPAGYEAAQMLAEAGDLRDGQDVVLAGYGITNGLTHVGAGLLRQVTTKIDRAVWGTSEVLIDQTRGKGACHGDSGGPAFVKDGDQLLLFGVTSRGPQGKPDDCASQAIYTNILAHKAFLKTAAEKLRKAN